VLLYTTPPLITDLEVIGSVRLELYVRSSLEHTDFFVRLCDVHRSGRSINISDGLRRVRPGDPSRSADGTMRLELELWPTAHRFRRGHRLRVQVSSGAHPRYARNLGTGEPLATGTGMRVADQTVYHDPAHLSGVLLPRHGPAARDA
jgi:putative CocE/NonD family hydrolase